LAVEDDDGAKASDGGHECDAARRVTSIAAAEFIPMVVAVAVIGDERRRAGDEVVDAAIVLSLDGP
jgi:hypothetical protein